MKYGVGKILPQDSSSRVIFVSLYTVDVLAMARFLGKVTHVMWRCVSLFFWVVENKKAVSYTHLTLPTTILV